MSLFDREEGRPRKSCGVLHFFAAVVGLLAMSGALAGCSGDEDDLPDILNSMGGALPRFEEDDSCEDGDKRPCGVTLELEDGAMTCYRGQQICEDEEWSECQGGKITKEARPFSIGEVGKLKLQSLSTAAKCDTDLNFENPCDPECMFFDEDPMPDITFTTAGPMGPVTVTTRTCIDDMGNPGSACTPTTVGFDATCDPCVAAVCDANATCCTTAWTSTCVDAAKVICEGQILTTDLTVCDMGLYTEALLEMRNRPHTKYANIASRTRVYIETDNNVGTVYSGGDIDVRSLNGATVDTLGGGWYSNGNILFQNAGGAKIYGDLQAQGYIQVDAYTLYGDAWAKGNITGSGTIAGGYTARAGGTVSASITGSKTSSYTPYPPPVVLPPAGSIPVLPVDCTGTNDIKGYSMTPASITPGVYGEVIFAQYDPGELTLLGQGTYYFKSLGNLQKLILDPNGAPISQGWDVRTCDVETPYSGVFFKDGAVVAGGGTLAASNVGGILQPQNLLTVYIDDTDDVFLDTDSYFSGILMAPNALVKKQPMNNPPWKTIGESQVTSGTAIASINGAIWAKQALIEPDNFVWPMTAASCKGISSISSYIPGGSCDVDTGMKGLKTEPCSDGQDCQANSTCMDPDNGTCAHSKCVSGSKLDATCDDCVDRICDVDPACCTTSWSSSCVAKVASVCDAQCGAIACNFDTCTPTTGPIDATCDDGIAVGDGCIDDVCTVMPSCCSTAWTAACVTELFNQCPTARLCDYAAYGSNSLSLGTNSTVGGGSGTDATTGDPDPPFPSVTFDCSGTTDIGPWYSADATLNSAIIYNSVHLDWGHTLTFPTAGTYYFNDLRLEGDNIIDIPTSGDVNIVVCGKVFMGEDTDFTGITGTGNDRFRLRIYSNDSGADAIWSNYSTSNHAKYGVWIAPNGEVKLGYNNNLYGAVWGDTVTLTAGTAGNDGADIIGYGATQQAYCETNNIDGGVPTSCPVVTEPAGSTSSCVDNAVGYQDSSCAGYDLAVGVPCDDEVPICNHGTVAFDSSTEGDVELAFYHPDLAQLAVDEPLLSETGLCTQPMKINPGECEPMICAIPNTDTYTVMVDPNHILSECDDRRLDNWSADDGQACASATPGTENDYEADCPKDTSAQWRFLTWSTSTPGTTEVNFYAQVVDDPADFDAMNYVLVGNASAAAATEDCPYTTMSPCFSQLDTALSLGQNQGQFLYLKLEGTGGMPVVEDWAVTYTCVYDE